MTSLTRFVRSWLAARKQAADAVASLRTVREELSRARRAVEALRGQVAVLERRLEQLTSLHAADAQTPDRLTRLERALESGSIDAHVRRAIQRAPQLPGSDEILAIGQIVPPEVLACLVDAIPPPIFFDHEERPIQELRLPVPLVPLSAAATWQFMARLLMDIAAPAALARLNPGVAVATDADKVLRARLLRFSAAVPLSDLWIPPTPEPSLRFFLLMDAGTTAFEPGTALCLLSAGPERPFAPSTLAVTSAGHAYDANLLVRTGT